jgi:hypothetical protein
MAADDLYAVLGLAPTASAHEVKAAYRKLARAYHPDTHPNDAYAAERMRAINHAHHILADPHRRWVYDQQRAREALLNAKNGDTERTAPKHRPAPQHTPTDPLAFVFAQAQAAAQAPRRPPPTAPALTLRQQARHHAPFVGVMAIIALVMTYFFVVHKHVVVPQAELDLSKRSIGNLPRSLVGQHEVQVLNLSTNGIKHLDEDIATLPYLRRLVLKGNKLQSLPETMAQLRLLSHLSLAKCNLRNLPPVVPRIPNLYELDLSENLLDSLPHTLGRMPRLRVLNLSQNPLRRLPPDLSGWVHLRELNLSNTLLEPREQFRVVASLPYTRIQF